MDKIPGQCSRMHLVLRASGFLLFILQNHTTKSKRVKSSDEICLFNNNGLPQVN